MAKRRKTATKTKTRTITRTPQVKIVKVNTGVAKRSRGRRRGGSSLARIGGQLLSTERIGAMIGSYILGMLDAKGTKLPTMPFLGRAGTLGVGLYYLGKHVKYPMVSHAATGFLSVAAYEMGNKGAIAGDAVVGDSVVGSDTI